MTRLRDQFEQRPDGRAGDIQPIWPLDPHRPGDMAQQDEPDCGLDWLVIGVWTAMGAGCVGFWALIYALIF